MLVILLPQPPTCWDYMCTSLCLAYACDLKQVILLSEPQFSLLYK